MIQMTGRCPVPEDGGTQTVTRPISEIMDLTLVIILQKPKIHFLQLFIIVLFTGKFICYPFLQSF